MSINKSSPSIVLLASAVGLRNRGIGQYERHLLPLLLPRLLDRGWDVDLFLSKDCPEFEIPAGIRIRRLPVVRDRTLWRILSEQIIVPWIAREADHFVSLESVFPLIPVRARKRSVVIHDIHVLLNWKNPEEYPEDYSLQYRVWANLATRRAAKSSDRIITVSEFTRREIHSLLGIPMSRIRAVPNGVDHGRFYPLGPEIVKGALKRYGLPTDFYLFVGPYSRKKNLRLVAEAYAGAGGGKKASFPVAVIGDTRRNPLYIKTLEYIRKHGLGEKFIFLGSVPGEDLPALYSGAKAFLYPSLYEGFGLPVLESMACGTPVIAVNRTSIPEVAGNAALLVEPGDSQAFFEAMIRMAEADIREKWVEKGLRRAQEYSWEKTSSGFLTALFGE